jgi:hydroxymethylpyrimidine/phosphomethylpyrimidine kinase
MPAGSHEELASAARELQRRLGDGTRGQPIGVLAKGGHLERPDDLVLRPEGEEAWLAGERIETNATHGTGCALSSAFLSRLVLGDGPVEAARRAKGYVLGAMRNAPGIGSGKGPMGLLWPLVGERNR